ncbi:sodium-coupled monocarboxylate transporter 2-like [Haliotis rubra]|uniref:sodium-coupled monocarboxylate transporter 2-like n=1 Tax=Haliotis rubra TaxID=36100 RepID=UPI001EE5E52E|nr:sodium-coupled monocarboxylate transporter 2-like [Haliotis rubra]
MAVEGTYSINTGKIQTFGVADYTITVAMLVSSAAIGVFYVIKDRHHNNVNEYLLGGRRMHYIPVSMSLLVTYLSALSLLGAPVEVYRTNTMLFWFGISVAIGCAVVGRVFLPFFYQLGITNVFQYLEKRFGKRVRTLALTCFLIQALFYTSVVVYAPSLAVSAVTGFNVWGIAIVLGAVSTIYTALGGMKAVLWTDTLQGSIMVIGCVVLVVKGSAAVGGFSNAWAIAENRSRIKIDDFSFDPKTTHSVWAYLFGAGTMWVGTYGTQQAEVQRALSCSSLRSAQIALGINAVGYMIVYILLVMVGVIMFAFYSDCHPVSFNIIDKDDQLLPLMVMDILGDVPALPGLIISSILCGSLSTISSILNALGTVIPDQLIKPYFLKHLSDKGDMRLAKLSVLICGVVVICASYVISLVGALFQGVMMIIPVLHGPMAGIFCLAMFCPWANRKGAVSGYLMGIFITAWICFGSFATRSPSHSVTLLTHGCNWNLTFSSNNVTSDTTTEAMMSHVSANTSHTESQDPFYPMYRLSYLYYSLVATVVVSVVGSIVSLLTGPVKPESVDPRLVCPLFDKLLPFLPERVLKPLRFGVDYEGKYSETATDHHQHEDVSEMKDKFISLRHTAENTDEHAEDLTWNKRL